VAATTVALVQRFYERYLSTGQIPWDMVDERVEVHDHDTPDQGAYRGHAGVERWLQDWADAWSEWDFEPEEFIEAGKAVIVVIRMRAKGAGSGVELDRQDALVYRFSGDKIVRTDYYNSKAQALEAAGASA
jgi:ketosteroid isomerase-like protein